MEFDRRAVIKGLAGLPLAAVLAEPMLARAVAAKIDSVTIRTARGQSVSAILALPARLPAPAVLLIHEWWGLNDHIRTIAVKFAREGYIALAVDLFHGKVATNLKEAERYSRGTKPGEAIDTLKSWIGWLRKSDKVNGRIATIGWRFGGGWSLNASIAAPADATVIYYGRVDKTAKRLKRLEGPVLGHFATRDKYINRKMVSAFEAEMEKIGKFDSMRVHWYDADSSFADPTGSNYDGADAKLAWRRTLSFLRDQM